MQLEKINSPAISIRTEEVQTITARDVIAIGFRQRRLIFKTFLSIFGLAVLLGLVLPAKYVAEMKLLVRHERAEPVVSAEPQSSAPSQTEVSEAELQSEAELIRSKDILAKVIVACNLQGLAGRSFWHRKEDTADRRIARAVVNLENNLTVEPIKLTNMISVSYKSKDPQMAAKVLHSLAGLYLEKHLAVHRAAGQFEFFHQQSEQYRKALAADEEKLTSFTQQQGVVSPALEKEIGVRKLAEFQAESQESHATVAGLRQKIRTLESELSTLPKRETTAVRTSDNPQLMQTLKSKLLDLELQRTELLSKFAPTYRPVQDVEHQITQAKAAINAAEQAPLRDETTDRDPTYEALRSDLAKAKTDLAATEARATATSTLIADYRKQNQNLDRAEVLHQDMLRTVKNDEENYTLYLQKAEEARISDALDRQRFSNVVVAEPATVPYTAHSHFLLVTLVGAVLAALVSVILAFLADRWDPSFRTPAEVEAFLGSPVIAALPRTSD